MDVWCVTAFVSAIQFLLSLPLFLTVLLPMPEYLPELITNITGNVTTPTGQMVLHLATPVVWNNLPSYMNFSYRCMFGDFMGHYPTNMYGPGNDTETIMSSTLNRTIPIDSSSLFFEGTLITIFVVINVFFNIFATDLLKMTTANISAIISVFTLIATNFIFAIQPIAGIAYRPPLIGDFVALAGTTLGIAIFWAFPEAMRKKDLKERTTSTGKRTKRVGQPPKLKTKRKAQPQTIREKMLTCSTSINLWWAKCCYPCCGTDSDKTYGWPMMVTSTTD